MREWDFAVYKKGITKYCHQDSDLIYITIFRFSRCYERLLQEVVMKRAINELSRKAICTVIFPMFEYVHVKELVAVKKNIAKWSRNRN